MHEIELSGIDGSNLLGYMAALGTLRVLALAGGATQVRMSWVDRGVWTPIILHSGIAGPDELVATLARALYPASRPFKRDYLDLSLPKFRRLLSAAAQMPHARAVADFWSALGSDAFPGSSGSNKPATTSLRAIGAGNNEGFLGFMRTIHKETSSDQLRRSLFYEWDYADPPPFMRWDPNEYRPHALRASDPAKDRKRNNVRGANRLAVEALPLYPVVPGIRRSLTVAFQGDEVSCPIWTDALDLASIGSLLASREVQDVDRFALRRRGVAQVFRSRRFTEGKYRNFSPARATL